MFCSFAMRGTIFERTYAAASWTIPSIASVLTGVLPSQHGIEHAHLEDDGSVRQETLSPELPSLPGSLRAAGYRTYGMTATGHFDAALGYGHGFDDYECLGFVERDVMETSLTTRIEALHAEGSPYFLWIHIIDPHIPYTPTEPWFSQWWGEDRPRYPSLDTAQAGWSIGAAVVHDHIPPREALEYSIAAWDSEIRASDAFLYRLLELLDDGHLAVVVTGDHGEEFFEHFAMGHGNTLFEEVVHVPLVISVPGQRASVARHLVSLMDLLPTLLEVGGAPLPESLGGRSLMPIVRGEEFPMTRDIVMETGGPAIIRGIFDGRYKYGERIEPNPVQALFDLETDPDEHHVILSDHPEIADPLRDRLHQTLAAARARRPAVVEGARQISDEYRRQLEDLGYGNAPPTL
jgi:arylsulfatase A-like enzyme